MFVLTASTAIYDTAMRTLWKIYFPISLTRGASSTQDGEARQRTKHHLIVFPSLVEFPFERLYPKIISQTTYHNQHKNTQILVLISEPYQEKGFATFAQEKQNKATVRARGRASANAPSNPLKTLVKPYTSNYLPPEYPENSYGYKIAVLYCTLNVECLRLFSFLLYE